MPQHASHDREQLSLTMQPGTEACQPVSLYEFLHWQTHLGIEKFVVFTQQYQ